MRLYLLAVMLCMPAGMCFFLLSHMLACAQAKLMTKEMREMGTVSWRVVKGYFQVRVAGEMRRFETLSASWHHT